MIIGKNIKIAALAAFILGCLTFISLGTIIVKSGGIVRPAEYPNPQGFTQAIYYFEMVADEAELAAALGDPATEQGRAIRASMDITNRIDFFFMTCYTSFLASLVVLLFLLVRGAYPRAAKALLAAGLVFSAATLLGDVMETRLLLRLTGPGGAAAAIAHLNCWARVKFGGIAAAGIVLSVFYLLHFGRTWQGVLFAVLFFGSSAVGLAAVSVFGLRHLIEVSANAGGAAWMAGLAHAGIMAFRRPAAP